MPHTTAGPGGFRIACGEPIYIDVLMGNPFGAWTRVRHEHATGHLVDVKAGAHGPLEDFDAHTTGFTAQQFLEQVHGQVNVVAKYVQRVADIFPTLIARLAV